MGRRNAVEDVSQRAPLDVLHAPTVDDLDEMIREGHEHEMRDETDEGPSNAIAIVVPMAARALAQIHLHKIKYN